MELRSQKGSVNNDEKLRTHQHNFLGGLRTTRPIPSCWAAGGHGSAKADHLLSLSIKKKINSKVQNLGSRLPEMWNFTKRAKPPPPIFAPPTHCVPSMVLHSAVETSPFCYFLWKALRHACEELCAEPSKGLKARLKLKTQSGREFWSVGAWKGTGLRLSPGSCPHLRWATPLRTHTEHNGYGTWSWCPCATDTHCTCAQGIAHMCNG